MYDLNINFLTDRGLGTENQTTATEEKKPKEAKDLIPYIAGGLALVLLPFISFNYAKSFDKKIAKANEEIKRIDGEIAKITEENKNLEELEARVKKAEQETQGLISIFDKIRPWSAIIQEVGERTPPGVQFDSLSQSGSGSNTQLKIQGTARSFNDVNDFVLFLQLSPFFNKQNINFGNVSKVDFPVEIENEDTLPDNATLIIPEGVKYSITAQLSNTPTSKLVKELEKKNAVGVLTRLKTLEQKGVIK